jgi:poly(3-hydroxyalkanoate) synthetase
MGAVLGEGQPVGFPCRRLTTPQLYIILRSNPCPLYLLAGEQDDITPAAQVFGAARYFGAKPSQVVKDLAKGGHIGLFMGSEALSSNWPKIAAWLAKQEAKKAA